MKAFHSTWTAPFFTRQQGDFYIEDFELLTTILSALKWREFNGDIKMVTDKTGALYYKKLGLEFLWNLGIEERLENIPDTINPRVFWAAGKLYALKEEDAPIVMMDTDFIVWKPIYNLIDIGTINVIHREELIKDVYPGVEGFKMDSLYNDFDKLNWIVRPCNTAFSYIDDDEFKEYYTNTAIDFMLSAKGDNPLTYMVFAEQRLMAMCALNKEKHIKSICSVDKLFSNTQEIFTHIWGHKRHLRENTLSREKFCLKCINRIKGDYPEVYSTIKNIDTFKRYINV